MSLSSRSVSSKPAGEDRGELVVHDLRVVVDGMTLQYLEAGCNTEGSDGGQD